jgi:hypothetical protein
MWHHSHSLLQIIRCLLLQADPVVIEIFGSLIIHDRWTRACFAVVNMRVSSFSLSRLDFDNMHALQPWRWQRVDCAWTMWACVPDCPKWIGLSPAMARSSTPPRLPWLTGKGSPWKLVLCILDGSTNQRSYKLHINNLLNMTSILLVVFCTIKLF